MGVGPLPASPYNKPCLLSRETPIRPAYDNLSFLLADVSRLLRRESARRLEGTELTFAQARVLVHLARDPGLRQVELAARLEVQPITLARVLDQLEQRGLVERRDDPSDRRARRVFVTSRAREPIASIRRIGAEVRSEALAGIAPARVDELLQALAQMRRNLVDGMERRVGHRTDARAAP